MRCFKGRYIKYVGQGGGGGGGGGFWGGNKYFRHILMGHEIFFKIFDGRRNIFLCSIFIILFFKFQSLIYFRDLRKKSRVK